MISKHILLPTDFSPIARNAIDYAIHIFGKEKCIFYLLNAFETGASGLSSTRGKTKNTRLYRAIKEASEREIKTLVKELSSNNENALHTFKGLSIPDSLLNAIGKTIIDYSISYVFMGSKGSSAVKEVFMGSSTVSVIKHIDFCRLIVVPENYTFRFPKQIAFATNFKQTYSKVALAPLIDLANLWDSEVVIVHVATGKRLSPQQESSKNALVANFDGLSLSIKEVPPVSKISAAIQLFAANHTDVGMIAMVNYWHGFFKKLTTENVINNLAFHTKVPLLIFPFAEP